MRCQVSKNIQAQTRRNRPPDMPSPIFDLPALAPMMRVSLPAHFSTLGHCWYVRTGPKRPLTCWAGGQRPVGLPSL